jgi:chromosome segregation ATPase
MPTRYKIFILLFSLTLGLGTFILLQPNEDHNDAVLRFRSLFSNRPVYSVRDLSNTVTSLGDESSLWYGGIAFFALIMMGLTFKMARTGPQARHAQPEKPQVAKTTDPASTPHWFQDGAGQEQSRQRKQDAAAKDPEAKSERVSALEAELSEKEKLLTSRERELEALQSQVSVLTDRAEESMLREELTRKTESLQQKESAIEELGKSLSEKVNSLESQLREKEQLLKSRSEEAEMLRSELNTTAGRLTGLESANERTGVLLQDELQKKARVLQEKESLVRELKESTDKTVDVLKHQLDARESLLKNRDAELAALRSEIATVSSRLHESGAAKEQAERLLQAERSKAKRQSQARTQISAVTDSQESLMTVQDLKSRLSEKDPVSNTPEGRIQKLEADLKEKKTQLARYEIQIRQYMERRNLWKRRLAKFGITLKDR